jgi:ParB family chromosome partitioning protein
MQVMKKRPLTRRGGIIYLPVEDIYPSPVQPRRGFDETGIDELARSIGEYGILNPLTVRLRTGRYELVAGERRLRAARKAGLAEVPCILLDISMEDASLIALVENLQRQDLDFIEEAQGIDQLIKLFGMSQEEAARRIGKSQSAIANKLRILRLPPDVQEALRQNELTERHGRALLRLNEPREQRDALKYIVANKLTVAQTDEYVESLLAVKEAQELVERQEPKKLFILKDVRVFMNTIMHGVDLMKQGGIDAGVERTETDEKLILTISIPKSRPDAP